MRKTSPRAPVAIAIAALLSLGAATQGVIAAEDDGDAPGVIEVRYDFLRDAQGWLPSFADLPADADLEPYQLEAGWRPLPEGLEGNSLYSQGANLSGDLWMSWQLPVWGLEPDTTYLVETEVELASNIPAGLVGIGGSPGESVYVKAGASSTEPVVTPDEEGWLRTSIDQGNQSESGEDMVVIGTLANPNLDPENADGSTWALLTLGTTGSGVTTTTDDTGTLWVVVGTDSAFEGLTSVYYASIGLRLTPQGDDASQ